MSYAVVAVVKKGHGHSGAKVKFIHNVADGPSVDIYVDGKVLVSGVPYPTVSNYFLVNSGSHNIDVVVSGTKNVVTSATVDVKDGHMYTFIVKGKAADASVLGVKNDTSCPSGDVARIRFIHLAVGGPAVDIYVRVDDDTYERIFENISYGTVTDYEDIEGGVYDLRIAATGDVNNSPVDLPDVHLQSGEVQSLVATGDIGQNILSALVSIETSKLCIHA